MEHRKFDTWVFDVDNTLYHPSVRLFDQIEAKMEAFMMREIGLSHEEAKAKRKDFWRNHGTTLAGLVEVYGIDPDPFLDEVHDIDHSVLPTASKLRDALNALEGRLIVYTNGSKAHGKMVTEALGIYDCFDELFGIEDAGYKPKPHRIAFERVFGRAGLEPKSAIMFEDDPRNLAVPHELGMATVLVGSQDDSPHIHRTTDDLAGFLTRLSGN